jgi:hypothetical protein
MVMENVLYHAPRHAIHERYDLKVRALASSLNTPKSTPYQPPVLSPVLAPGLVGEPKR